MSINEVIALHTEITGIKYHKEKRKRFSLCVSALSEEAVWLLTFCCWFSLFNFRCRPIDESNYYSIPHKEVSEASFSDFLEVVRFYNRKRVTPSRESELISFLNRCDREEQDFYLLLLSKKFTKNLPIVEIQTVLQLDSINIQDIYGSVEMLQTGFSELTYPVAITGVTAPDMPLSVVSKEPQSVYHLALKDGKLKRTSPFLPADMKYINTPRFTLVGLAAPSKITGRTIFHPIDYFDTLKEFRNYLRDKNVPAYPERIEKLRRFQQANLLTQITTDYTGLAHREEEVLPEVVKVMEKSSCGYVVLADGNTLRTGQAFAAGVSAVVGIIEGFWIESGSVRGFQVWFNGELFDVPFSFLGRNNSLLNNIAPVEGKLLEFLYLTMGSNRIGVGRKVLWDTPAWRPKRLRGSGIRIEKCVLCGDTKHPHANRGVCRVCETNLYRFFNQYGPGAWITPSDVMLGKRRKTGWEPVLLNTVQYRFQGHLLEARADGHWRFAPNIPKGEQDEG